MSVQIRSDSREVGCGYKPASVRLFYLEFSSLSAIKQHYFPSGLIASQGGWFKGGSKKYKPETTKTARPFSSAGTTLKLIVEIWLYKHSKD